MKNSLKTQISHIVLALCTYKRPQIFAECLNTISQLELPADIKIDLLIIDNDPNASAKALIENIRSKINMPIYYFVETQRGLANARNRLIKEALNLGASHIAMFDDDILLPQKWLINYINYYNLQPNAVIITAASYSKFTEIPPAYIRNNDLFRCSTFKQTGAIRSDAASGNVFFPTSLITELKLNFNNEYVFMGGEDGRFFEEASQKGAVIVWCNDCYNYELNGTDKINISWIIKRSRYNGFSAAKNAMKRLKNKNVKVLYVIKQLISFIINCFVLPFSILTGLTGFVNMLGFTVKSLGKIQGACLNTSFNYYENIYGE